MLSCRINCISLMCIFMLPTTTTYETKCPDASQWRFRSKAICSVTSKYNCLFDDNRKIYLEFCTHAPDFLPAGRKYVVRGQRDGEDCERERYNPFIFKTNESSQCHYKKYKCNEDGQFKSSNGSTTNDVSCRCDYRRNFAFINQPKDPCHCVPSAEDCTCFKKDCPPGYHLSDDSSCISDYSITAPVCEIVKLTKGDEMYKILKAIRKSSLEPDISSNSLTEGFLMFKRIRNYDLAFVTLVLITMLYVVGAGTFCWTNEPKDLEKGNMVRSTVRDLPVAAEPLDISEVRPQDEAVDEQERIDETPVVTEDADIEHTHDPKRQKREKVVALLSEDEEHAMVEWLESNPILYNKKLKSYKDTAKKEALWREKAEELGKDAVVLKTWYTSLRTRYGRLKKVSSGQEPQELAERDAWILRCFEFLKPHIVEVQKRTMVSSEPA